MSPKPEEITWVYWVSRDSVGGELSPRCSLWVRKPTRVRHGEHITWCATDGSDPGHLGIFPVDYYRALWRVYPETDLELIKVETRPNQRELDRSLKEQEQPRNINVRFYGGSWDGQTKNGNFAAAKRVYVAVGNRRELYERDRSRHVKNEAGEIVELAYKFIGVE